MYNFYYKIINFYIKCGNYKIINIYYIKYDNYK